MKRDDFKNNIIIIIITIIITFIILFIIIIIIIYISPVSDSIVVFRLGLPMMSAWPLAEGLSTVTSTTAGLRE